MRTIRTRRFRTVSLMALAATALVAGPAIAPASAAGPTGVWSASLDVGSSLITHNQAFNRLVRVSCPTTDDCTAIGSLSGSSLPNYESFAVSRTGGVWGAAQQIAPAVNPSNPETTVGGLRLNDVSCASPGNCSAVGWLSGGSYIAVVDQVNGTWGVPQIITTAGTPATIFNLNAVSCPSVGNCVAGGGSLDGIGGTAIVVTRTNGVWGQTEAVSTGTAAINSISCTSMDACSAGGYTSAAWQDNSAAVVTKTGGTWGTMTPVAAALHAVTDTPLDTVLSVSCSSAGNCAAAGYTSVLQGAQHAFVVDQINGTWAPAQAVATSLSSTRASRVNSISCGADGSCSAGGVYLDYGGEQLGFIVSANSHVWGTATKVVGPNPYDQYAAVLTVSCASAGSCSAGGFYTNPDSQASGLVLTQTNGTWDVGTPIAGPAGAAHDTDTEVTTIDCPAVGRCTAGGYAEEFPYRAAFVVTESPVTLPVLSSGPFVTGTARVGHTLTCRATYTGPSAVTYRWQRDGVGVGTAKSTYALTSADYKHRVGCTAQASNGAGSTAVTKSPTVSVAVGSALRARSAPGIGGRAKVGKTLKAKHGAWTPAAGSYTYQWRIAGKSVRGATHASFKLPKKAKGKRVSVKVTAHRTGYANGSAVSASVKVKAK